MRNLCLYFQVHQPFRFRRYRFFDIGNEHYYYDDYTNESILRKVADKCYLPANALMLSLIKKYPGKFKIAFSISGVAIDQFELYAPAVLDSFRQLADTGCVEFLAETNAHSLVSLKDGNEFREQVQLHVEKIKKYFGQTPKVFRNTELIYSDDIGAQVADMGYEAMLTEGAKHILGWKSPNYLYCNAINPKLKVLLKNFKLSDDIAFRFSNQGWSEYPLTAEKFVSWLNRIDKKEEIVNLFMDYETFGEHQWEGTGIFRFLEALPGVVLKSSDYSFVTPSEVAAILQPVAAVQVAYPISWADEERDLTAWLGNELQQEAFNKLYEQTGRLKEVKDPVLIKDWNYLQVSDHFYYMCTKFFSDDAVHSYFNPYQSPYDAFINYMNILSDFVIRLNALVPQTSSDMEKAHMARTIEEKEKQLAKYKAEIDRLSELINTSPGKFEEESDRAMNNTSGVQKEKSKRGRKPGSKAITTITKKRTSTVKKTGKK
jgi:alpha-amylase